MMKIIKKIIWPVIAALPLVIGTVGYVKSGERLTNGLYAAFALYFTNPVSDVYNMCIETARWTAPLVTATAILAVIQNVWSSIRCRFSLLGKRDSVAVYSDVERNIDFEKGVGVIYPGETFKKYAREHIIMFSSDQKNLQFYEEHKDELSGKKVYIGLKDLECSILKPFSNASIFDVNSAIARILWKRISLWNRTESEVNIVIRGDSALAGDILSTGLQLNLFSCSQHINYHVITDNAYLRIRLSDLSLINDDEVHFYESSDPGIWGIISEGDIVIISDDIDIEALKTVVIKAVDAEIFYYSPKDGDAGSYISYGNIIPFGRNETVYTDDNIRRKALVKKAIALNEHYANLYGSEKNWDLLSGFLKGSNISASDFGEVLSDLNDKISEEEQAELEHIRWCRYLLLNNYRYGVPENGENRDDVKRIHKDLVKYSDLEPSERDKDKEAIRITRNLQA